MFDGIEAQTGAGSVVVVELFLNRVDALEKSGKPEDAATIAAAPWCRPRAAGPPLESDSTCGLHRNLEYARDDHDGKLDHHPLS